MSQPGTDLWTLGVIVGLTVVTVVTRSFFFLSSREWQLPHWAQRGLQIPTWQDARLFGAAAGAAFYFARRGQGQAVLGTIVVGMAVYLPLHLGLGW